MENGFENKIYWITYNRLSFMPIETISNVALNSRNNYLKHIAYDIINNYDFERNNALNSEVIRNLIDCLPLEVLWNLATKNRKVLIYRLAYDKLMSDISKQQYEKELRIIY